MDTDIQVTAPLGVVVGHDPLQVLVLGRANVVVVSDGLNVRPRNRSATASTTRRAGMPPPPGV